MCYTGGCLNPDSFLLEETSSLPRVYLVHLELGQTAMVILKPIFKVRYLAKLCEVTKAIKALFFKTLFNISNSISSQKL